MLGAGHQIAAGHLSSTLNSQRISMLVVAFIPFGFFYMFFGGLWIPVTLFPHGIEIFPRFMPAGEVSLASLESVALPVPERAAGGQDVLRDVSFTASAARRTYAGPVE